MLPAPPVRKEGEAESAVVTHVALFDMANSECALLPDMTAQVFFATESAAQVLAVPATAPNEDGSLRVLTDPGWTETRCPETGMRIRAFIEIRSGLAEGEPVVVGIRAPEAEPLLRLAP